MVNKKDLNKDVSSTKMTTQGKLGNVLAQLTLMAMVGFIIFRTVNEVSVVLYTLHPSFMAIGYLILMSNGILSMADKNVFTQNFSHQKRVTTHWLLQAFALILITIAQSAIYVSKDRNGYPHYQTNHSILGLVTYLLTLFVGTFGGVATKYSYQLRKFVKPAVCKVGHAFGGISIYIIAVVTIFSGINQTWTEDGDENVKIGLAAALAGTSFYVVKKSFKLAVHRLKEVKKLKQ